MRAVLLALASTVLAVSTACAPTCTQISSGPGGCCDSDVPCHAGLACDPTGTCQFPTIDPDRECVANTTRCVGEAGMEICDADGRAWRALQDCDHRCEDGACIDPPCDTFPDRCEGTRVVGCERDAGRWTVLEECASSCSETDAGAGCSSP